MSEGPREEAPAGGEQPQGPLPTRFDRLRDSCRRVQAWIRTHGKRPELGAAPFAVVAACLVVLLNNRRLFSLMAGHADLPSLSGFACIAAVLVALVGMVGIAFLVLGAPYVMKPLVAATLLLSSVLSYFTQELGTVFDHGMIRNIVDNVRERDSVEAFELASGALALHVLLFGVLPSVLAFLPRIVYRPFRRELISRSRVVAVGAALLALLVLPNFRYLVYFSREHPVLRCYATPTFALASLYRYAASPARGARAPFTELGADAVQQKSGRRRTVGILVVGETARADHFSLNGYGRDTNPHLGHRTLVNFPDAHASGTSTAFSVPCMFSFLGRKQFSPEAGARQSNVLDVLSHAGVKVVWIDNNSGPKHVCDRLGYVDLRDRADPSSPLFGEGCWYDEALVEALQPHLDSTPGDLLVVLHVMGSHGPAYYRRYPPAFEVFKPCCKDSSPQRSPQEEVVNAYDNSILYTDHVLDRLIALLEGRKDAAFLYYVSDHGESLGENGIYLHGLPDVLAPAAQTHIPMLAWLSPDLVADRGLDLGRLKGRAAAACSHDNVPHTVLGLYQVTTSLYRRELDLMRSGD